MTLIGEFGTFQDEIADGLAFVMLDIPSDAMASNSLDMMVDITLMRWVIGVCSVYWTGRCTKIQIGVCIVCLSMCGDCGGLLNGICLP